MVLRIRERREALGLTQTACAASLGVAQNVLSMWENETALPRTKDIPLLVRVLECDSYDDLFVDPPYSYDTA